MFNPSVERLSRSYEQSIRIRSHAHLPVGSTEAEAALSANISVGLPQSEGAAARRGGRPRNIDVMAGSGTPSPRWR